MPTEILMPALSPTMEEGTLAKWLVKEGDTVASGDLLAEIETDKATMEFEAVDEGTIGRILVDEGTEGVKVNSPIAVLLAEGEDAGDIDASAGASAQPQADEHAAPAEPSDQTAPAAGYGRGATDASPGTGGKPDPAPGTGGKPDPAPETGGNADPADSGAATGGDTGRIFASPLARRIAKDRGLDLAQIKGSGPHGRIVKADVESAQPAELQAPAAKAPDAAAAAAPEAAAPAAAEKTAGQKPAMPAGPTTDQVRKMYDGRAFEEKPLDGMRRTIAARLTEAKQTIPHFYLRRDIPLDALLKFRSQINKDLEPRGVKLSVNDFIIKAGALALQQVPAANAVWAADRILELKPSDVAVAVAIEGGLFTPVIRDAHQKTLSAISAEMKDLATRARDRKLAPHEYQGGSFAISNLGMYGIDNFDAVINPPHGSILAVGAGTKKPVVGADGELTTATLMSVTLSCDHRVIDGALGAQFLDAIAQNLATPLAMLA